MTSNIDEPYRVGYDFYHDQTTLTIMEPNGSAITLRMGEITLRRLIRMLESTLEPEDENTC